MTSEMKGNDQRHLEILTNMNFLRLIVVGVLCFAANELQAYQVWTSTCKTPATVLNELGAWDRTAALLQGLNTNFATEGYYPGHQPGGELWPKIVGQFPVAKQNCFQPFTRNLWDNRWGPEGRGLTLDDAMPQYLQRSKDWGFNYRYIMLYDVRIGGRGQPIYYWEQDDVTEVRKWLDNNGYEHVGLMWNARQFSKRDREFSANPGIASVLLEAHFSHWETNVGDRRALLQWLTSDPSVSSKDIVFQLHGLGKRDIDEYSGIRRFVRSISAEILGSTEFVRSDRCILLPMTYPAFTKYWAFLPEHTPAGDEYGRSMTGLLLSLIEQEDRFTGTARGGLISAGDCSSYQRTTGLRDAKANGSLGKCPAVLGDKNIWRTGKHWLSTAGLAKSSTLKFHGDTLVVQSGGVLAQGSDSATFLMNNLVLDGGRISHHLSGSTTIDLQNKTFHLNSGSVISGGQKSNQDLRIRNANLVGDGTIQIAARAAGQSKVEFDSTVNTNGFRGTFAVRSNGILDLPPVSLASFGLNLSGSGRYRLDDEISVASLVINGAESPAGTYAYRDFARQHQTHLIDDGGRIHVRSDRRAIQPGKLVANSNWAWSLPSYQDQDDHVWGVDHNRLGVSSRPLAADPFEGRELVVQSDGEISSDVANAILNTRNLTLDGGTISNRKVAWFRVDLRGHEFKLNGGQLFADSGGHPSDLIFTQGRLTGSGNVEIAGSHPNPSAKVVFESSIDTAGFSGTFSVTDHAVLSLPTVTNASFALELIGSGKLQFDSTVMVQKLVIGGQSLAPGVYYYDDFTADQRASLIGDNGCLVVAGGKSTHAFGDGDLDSTETWGGKTPRPTRDRQRWRSLSFRLTTGGGGHAKRAFHGQTLQVDRGGEMSPSAGGQVLQMNNLVMDGGSITNSRVATFTIDLSGNEMELNAGRLIAGATKPGRHLSFQNGVLGGSGTIGVRALGPLSSEVQFQETIKTNRFTGVFEVTDHGQLSLPPIVQASFGVRLSGTGKYKNENNVALKSLVIDGAKIPAGVYTYNDFTPKQQQFLVSSKGVISVTR